MKIVVTYSSGGDWECGSYDHVLCFDYESPEAWLVHFDEKLKENKERLRKENETWQKWSRTRPDLSKYRDRKKQEEVCAAWQATNPGFPSGLETFEFCGHDFSIHDFKDDWLPEVQELNEWHDANRIYDPGVVT